VDLVGDVSTLDPQRQRVAGAATPICLQRFVVTLGQASMIPSS
jgi:hypothetical protein